MYSRDHKFLYVHNPKCGGTFIKHFILSNIDEEYNNIQNQSYFNERYNVTCERSVHPILKEIGEESKDYFKFSIVRNPFERVVSMYLFLGGWKYEQLMEFNKNSPLLPKLESFRKCYLDRNFNKFCKEMFIEKKALEFHRGYYENLWNRLSSSGKILVDKIYTLENIDFCINDLVKKFNFKNTKPYYDWRMNSTSDYALHKDHMDYYDDESYDIISNHFKMDLLEFYDKDE